MTLGLGFAVERMIFDSETFAGGQGGIAVGYPHLFGLPIDDTNHAMADGSIRFINYGIDMRIFYVMGDRTGNKIGSNR